MSELTDSEKVSEICCVYNAMDAVIHSLYESLDKFGGEAERSYGLTMALESLNDQIGKLVGAI